MKWVLLLLLFVCGGLVWSMQSPSPVPHPPGVIVAADPVQENPDRESWQFGEYTIRPLATFKIRARVLGKSRYHFDKEADLAQYDLALGWQHMSDSAVLDHIDVSQAGRWYYMSWDSLPPDAIDPNVYSANMHIIPDNDQVKQSLKDIREGSIIDMQGYLVQVISNREDWAWTSSTSRYDLGEKSCELVWAQNLTIEDANEKAASASN